MHVQKGCVTYFGLEREKREKKNLDRKIGHQGVRRVGKFSLQAHKKPINPSDPFSSFGISSSWTMNICSSHHHLLHPLDHLFCNHFSRKVKKSGSRKVVLQTQIFFSGQPLFSNQISQTRFLEPLFSNHFSTTF